MASLPLPPDSGAWPFGTGWAWRPPVWNGDTLSPGLPVSGDTIAPALKVFFEGEPGSVRVGPAAPGGVFLETLGPSGAFVSLVLDLPEDALTVIGPRSIVDLHASGGISGAEDRLEARINLRHGPDTACQSRPVQGQAGGFRAEFDLAYAVRSDARLSQIWVDLLLSDPGKAILTLNDLVLSARPRAEF